MMREINIVLRTTKGSKVRDAFIRAKKLVVYNDSWSGFDSKRRDLAD
jgi:phage anti-repressor protein